MEQLDYTQIGKIIAAMAALGTAAFGLVDASKAFWGGVSNLGFGHVLRCLKTFDQALTAALGDGWPAVFRAHWRNGVPKAEQKAIVRSMVRLGLTAKAVAELARIGRVKEEVLVEVVERLEQGLELEPRHLNAMGRVDAAMDALIDAAFERGDQQYRNASRLAAGLVAIALALVGNALIYERTPQGYLLAFLVGLLAVPVAPIAKDLTSSLSTAVRAVKAARGAV
jgi:hypothetical protein